MVTRIATAKDGNLDVTEGKVSQDKSAGGGTKKTDATSMTKDEFIQRCQVGDFTGIDMPK